MSIARTDVELRKSFALPFLNLFLREVTADPHSINVWFPRAAQFHGLALVTEWDSQWVHAWSFLQPMAKVLSEYDHDPRTPDKLFDQASYSSFKNVSPISNFQNLYKDFPFVCDLMRGKSDSRWSACLAATLVTTWSDSVMSVRPGMTWTSCIESIGLVATREFQLGVDIQNKHLLASSLSCWGWHHFSPAAFTQWDPERNHCSNFAFCQKPLLTDHGGHGLQDGDQHDPSNLDGECTLDVWSATVASHKGTKWVQCWIRPKVWNYNKSRLHSSRGVRQSSDKWESLVLTTYLFSLAV